MKRAYLFIYCVFLCLGLLNSCVENPRTGNLATNKKYSVEELNQKLYSSYAGSGTRAANFTSDDIVTPDYFGGSYVGGNKLIVLVKNDDGAKDVETRLGTNDNISFVNCMYSLQELKDLNAKLGKLLLSDTKLRDEIGWVAVSVRPIQNRIVVYLKSSSPAKISEFKKKISDSGKIIFDQLVINNPVDLDTIIK